MGIYGTPGIQCEGLQPYKDKKFDGQLYDHELSSGALVLPRKEDGAVSEGWRCGIGSLTRSWEIQSQLRGQVPGQEDSGILQENDPNRRLHSRVLPRPWGLQKYLCDDSFKCIENKSFSTQK